MTIKEKKKIYQDLLADRVKNAILSAIETSIMTGTSKLIEVNSLHTYPYVISTISELLDEIGEDRGSFVSKMYDILTDKYFDFKEYFQIELLQRSIRLEITKPF